MREAFNTISESDMKRYNGKQCFFTCQYGHLHIGICEGFNREGIIINWITNDPEGFCCGLCVYPNVEGSIKQKEWSDCHEGLS